MADRGEGDLLVFGEAATREHPVLLFVGREPNNALGKCHAVHRYGDSWTAAGSGFSCSFWNTAHGLCAGTIGRSARSLKAACVAAGTGPIAFADLSPVALDGSYTSAKKRRLREDVERDVIGAHVDRLFSHSMIRKRVSLVVASGLHGCGLDHGVPCLDAICHELGLPIRHIHSLSSTQAAHTHAARQAQLGEDVDQVRAVVTGFLGHREQAA